jgi:hypothetical protein
MGMILKRLFMIPHGLRIDNVAWKGSAFRRAGGFSHRRCSQKRLNDEVYEGRLMAETRDKIVAPYAASLNV